MVAQTVALRKSALLNLDLVLTVGAFIVPLFVSGPQFLVGTLVNFALFVYASRFPNKNILYLAVLPSLGAIGHGVLFGTYTPFLLYFLPFIWLGNIALIKSFHYFKNILSLPIAILSSAIVKVAILYSIALVFFGLDIVPVVFVSAMGIIQFLTAVTGGILMIITRQFFKNS